MNVGHLHIPSILENPLHLFDVDWQRTLEDIFFNLKIRHQDIFSDGLRNPESTHAIVTKLTSEWGFNISTIPNGFFHAGNFTNISAIDGLNFTKSHPQLSNIADGTFFVYMIVNEKIYSEPFAQDLTSSDHKYLSYEPGIILNAEDDPKHGVKVASITISALGSVLEVNNSFKTISKLITTYLPSLLPQFNPLQFYELSGQINLTSQLSNIVQMGKITKVADGTAKVNGKFDDGNSGYNMISINNIPMKFPNSQVSLFDEGMGGRIGNTSIAKFEGAKALIFAFIDANIKGYGIYPIIESQVSTQSDNAGNAVLHVQSGDGFYFNPLGLYRITEKETGKTEVKQGIGRDSQSITVENTLHHTYDYVNNTVTVKQIDNFKLYSPGNGMELFPNNSCNTGHYIYVDDTGVIRYNRSLENDNELIGKISAWHKNLQNTPAIPDNELECNGQIVNDFDSPYNNQTIPNLNGHPEGADSPELLRKEQMFLRGGRISGVGQEFETEDHKHLIAPHNHSIRIGDTTGAGENSYGRTTSYSTSLDSCIENETITMTSPVNPSDNNADRKIGNETRPCNMSVVYTIKIK